MDSPGRDPRPARSRSRQSFSGHGTRTKVEKDGFGLFIDDTVYTFADISVASLPILWIIMVTSPVKYGGVKSAAFIGWMTMVLSAALIRGGWITPFFTKIPGWVSLSPLLVGLRIIYYNATLAIVAYSGGWVSTTVQNPLLFLGWSLLVSIFAIGMFPTIAERVARWHYQ